MVWPYEYYKKFISHLFVTRLKNTVMIFLVSYLLTNIPCVWDYHISLKSLNPKTLNTRLNKSSLRETLHLFWTTLLLTSNISFKYYYYIYITIINRAHIKQEYYSYITNYLVVLDWLFPYLKWSKLYLLITYLPVI